MLTKVQTERNTGDFVILNIEIVAAGVEMVVDALCTRIATATLQEAGKASFDLRLRSAPRQPLKALIGSRDRNVDEHDNGKHS